MRAFFLFLFALSTLFSNVVAVVSEADLPTCALLCLETEILASTCSPSNTTCTCTNEPLVSAITTCVSSNCTVKEALTTKAYTENNCGAPIRNISSEATLSEAIGFTLVMITFILRITSKFTGAGGAFGMDDYTIALVVAMASPLCVLGFKLVKYGLGRDIWTLDPNNIYIFAKLFVVDEVLYLASLALIKISILFFYLRIFKEKRVRQMVYITMAVCLAYGIAFVGVSVFQCWPISGAWTNWDGTFKGHCNSINLQGWTSAAINIVLDLVVIILPLPELWKMQMSTQKKLSIISMFCVGFFITIVSILRLDALIKFGGTTNTSYDYVSVVYWSTVERDVGIICACMPALRALLKQTFPNVLTTTRHATEAHTTPKSPFVSFGSRKTDLEGGGSKAKIRDTDDFVPLVNLESANRSHLTLSGSKGT